MSGENNKNGGEKDLTILNKKILEIKKKIQLSEGQRKAHYEESDAEKKRNSERIQQLKKEIKDLYSQLRKPGKFDETILKTHNKLVREASALRNKRNEEVANLLDYKNIDQQKKLDLLRYQSKKQQAKLKKLSNEYQCLSAKAASKQAQKITEVSTPKQISSLENQIHRVDMNMMEAEHVRKNYRSIRDNLLEDSVQFESCLLKLEEDISKQEKEIQHLQRIHKEALELRDITKGTLLKQETMALNAGKARERQLAEFRARVEERKQELERLERRIFPSVRALVHQDSASSSEVTQSMAEDSATAKQTNYLESAFNKLKEATGETDIEQVLHRFLAQKETMSRLAYLRNITEKEKKDLETKKDFLNDELEAFKFAASKDKEQNMEDVEKVKALIEEQQKRKEKDEAENQEIIEQLLKISKILYNTCMKLEKMDSCPVPPLTNAPEEALEYSRLLEQKISSAFVLNRLRGGGEGQDDEELIANLDKASGKNVGEEAWLYPPGTTKPPDGKAQHLQPSETDEEEDVPTRGYLKRQAQIIVDAKSRRKQFNFNRGRK